MLQFIKNLFPVMLGGRSSSWSWFKKHYAKTHPKECAVCGNKKCDLHHIERFADCPEKELDEDNVVWLCSRLGTLQHHRGMGHLGSYHSVNEDLREDIRIWKEKFKNR